MPTEIVVTETCTLDTCKCEGKAPVVGNTVYCAAAIRALEADGWKFKPSGVRTRDGVTVTPNGNVKVSAGMYNSRMLALLAGEIPVEDLDEEELARGMCRNPDGSFPKRAPEMVPKIIVDRMRRELYERAEEGLRRGLIECVNTMVGIASNEAVAPADRMRAATFVLERVMGKTPDRVLIGQEKPFEVVLDKIARGPRTRRLPEAG